MANTNQAPDLESLHHVAEQVRIMNENIAHLIQYLAITNPPPPATAPVPAGRSCRSRRSGDNESQSHQSTGQSRNRRRRSPRRARNTAPRVARSVTSQSRPDQSRPLRLLPTMPGAAAHNRPPRVSRVSHRQLLLRQSRRGAKIANQCQRPSRPYSQGIPPSPSKRQLSPRQSRCWSSCRSPSSSGIALCTAH